MSISFAITNQIVACGSGSTLNNIWAAGGTVSAWCYARTYGENSTGNVCAKADFSSNGRWFFGFYGVGTPSLGLALVYSGNDRFRYATTLPKNQWVHVLATCADTSTAALGIAIYYAGSQATYIAQSQSATLAYNDATEGFYIGDYAASGAGNTSFNGIIEEVAMWNVVLNTQEIAMLAQSRMKGLPLQIRPGNLRGYWPMDDFPDGSTASGTASIRDRSSNNNHGTPGANPIGRAGEVLTY